MFDNLYDFVKMVAEKTSKIPDRKDFLNEYQNVAGAMGDMLPANQQTEVRGAQIVSAWVTFDLKGAADAYQATVDHSFVKGMDDILRDIPDKKSAPRPIDTKLIHSLDAITEAKATNAAPGLLQSLDEIK